MKEFKASEEFRKERLALIKVVGDQIVNKIHMRKPEFNTDFLDEESDEGDNGGEASDGEGDDDYDDV